MAKSICKMIVHLLDIDPDTSDMYYVLAEAVLYLLRVPRSESAGGKQNGAFAFQKSIKPWCCGLSAKDFRLKLHNYRNVSLGIKLLVLWQARHRALELSDMLDKATALGVCQRDAVCLYDLFVECSWYRREVKGVLKVLPKNCIFDSYEAVDAFYTRIEPEVMKKIRSITYRKLRFLAEANNEPLTEYHSTLSEHVVKVLHKMLPTDKSEEYIVNYVKQSIHNHAINLIKYGTSQKRGRLKDMGLDKNNIRRSASLQVVSINQMIPVIGSDGVALTPDAADPIDTAARFEAEFCVSEILDRFKHTTKRYRLITILLGEYDEEFSQWLRSKSLLCTGLDNTDFQSSSSPDQYNRLLSEFLRVSYNKVEQFLDSIRELLARERRPVIEIPVQEECKNV